MTIKKSIALLATLSLLVSGCKTIDRTAIEISKCRTTITKGGVADCQLKSIRNKYPDISDNITSEKEVVFTEKEDVTRELGLEISDLSFCLAASSGGGTVITDNLEENHNLSDYLAMNISEKSGDYDSRFYSGIGTGYYLLSSTILEFIKKEGSEELTRKTLMAMYSITISKCDKYLQDMRNAENTITNFNNLNVE